MSTRARSVPTTDNARNQKTSVEPRASGDVDAELAMIAMVADTCRQRSDFLWTSRSTTTRQRTTKSAPTSCTSALLALSISTRCAARAALNAADIRALEGYRFRLRAQSEEGQRRSSRPRRSAASTTSRSRARTSSRAVQEGRRRRSSQRAGACGLRVTAESTGELGPAPMQHFVWTRPCMR